MSKKAVKSLDVEKLYDNAIVSIQLGIEDFKLSQLSEAIDSNPARTLSSVRNLYAGLLLLFKYRIAKSVKSDEQAYELIHNPPPKVLPKPDGNGGVIWEPNGNFKPTTIDLDKIKERFEAFHINTDWTAVEKIRECRNHLEHLHPKNTFGEVAGFVAGLFPVLSDFITYELRQEPQKILGTAWETMLEQSNFYTQKVTECETSWRDADIPTGMQEFITGCNCVECGSDLLRASIADLDAGFTVSENDDVFKYSCIHCGEKDLIAPLLMNGFEDEFFFWPPNGDEPTYEQCYQCGHDTFVIHEKSCRWCESALDYGECSFCGDPLSQDEQENGGLCGYHYHMSTKDD
jgi:hypothetical protein